MCANNYIAPSLFLNHGGGPLPVLGEKNNQHIADALRNIPNIVDLNKLKAIILVTAHREEEIVTISSGQYHELIYDYNNFPPKSYELKYDAPGDPVLAGKLHAAFRNANIPSKLDPERGWDHGVFIPMMLINPHANIPIVQVSILKNQRATDHYNIGKVLYNFRKEGIAIFGSGMSYHNMKELRKAILSNDAIVVNDAFDEFLNDVCTGKKAADIESCSILSWEKFAGAHDAHPFGEADHLMPLIVNIGAAGESLGKNIFSSIFLQKFKLSGFIWS